MSKINLSELKQKRIRKAFDNGIEIYNLNSEEQKKVMSLITKNINPEDGTLRISGEDVLTQLLGLYSNIYIDTDNKELIKEILDDPSEELEEVIEEITEMVKALTNRTIKYLSVLSKMPKEEIDKILHIEEDKEEDMTEEEIKQLQILQEKAKKTGKNI